LRIEVIDFGGKLPDRAHHNDAGADLFSREEILLYPGMTRRVPVGIGIKVPDGYMGVVYSKSGMSSKFGIIAANAPIDSGYRGEIHAILTNTNPEPAPYLIRVGDKVGQLVILPIIIPTFHREEWLDEKPRGADGFGSTGKS